MYSLPYFKEKDRVKVLEFMRQHPFVTLCGCDESHKPVVTQIPVLIKERNTELFLEGHFMKNTDHHMAFVNNPEALVIFTGPDTYVSASWYENKQEASTWNYISVHARGRLIFLDNDALLRILSETTAHFENNPDSPSSFDKLPTGYIDKLSKAIIAFEIPVQQLDNVFKLSQNHHKQDQQAVIDHLLKQDSGAQAIAHEMEKRIEQKEE